MTTAERILDVCRAWPPLPAGVLAVIGGMALMIRSTAGATALVKSASPDEISALPADVQREISRRRRRYYWNAYRAICAGRGTPASLRPGIWAGVALVVIGLLLIASTMTAPLPLQ
jgi:hypothetical protein